jgi:glycosyltransferase involved in cell wall biosynthesis
MSTVAPENIRVLCFIPMRNCQGKISLLLDKLQGPLLTHFSEILVVDNASDDGSVEEAKQKLLLLEGIKTTLIQNSRNYGFGGSHKIAFNYAKEHGHDFVFVINGDNSANPDAFETVFNDAGFQNFDLILGDRLSCRSKRTGYPFYRFFFNKLISLFASLLSGEFIGDYTGAPMNLYRVHPFLNKFENSIKNFSNEVEFPQFMILYAIYRRMKWKYVPISFTEQDSKTSYKLASQFLKGSLILLQARFWPNKFLASDLYGSFFGHTYQKIKLTKTANVPAPQRRPQSSENHFIDIHKVTKIENPRTAKTGITDFVEDFLFLKIVLRPFHLLDDFLVTHLAQLLKEVPAERIVISVNGDEVVKSKQCYDFLTFCLDNNIETQLVTNGVGDINLWRNYVKLVKNVTFNFVPGEVSRSFFFELCKEIAPLGNVSINVMTLQDHFFQSYGLMKKIERDIKNTSLILQPYPLVKNERLPEDHLEILLDQQAVITTYARGDISRKHIMYPLDHGIKDKTRFDQWARMGFMNMAFKNQLQKDFKVFVSNDTGEEDLFRPQPAS